MPVGVLLQFAAMQRAGKGRGRKGKTGRTARRGIGGGFPSTAEKDYADLLRAIISEAVAAPVSKLEASAQSTSRFADSVGDDIETADALVDKTIEEVIKKHYEQIQTAAKLIDYSSQRYFSRTAESVIGSAFNSSAPNADKIIDSWKKENLSLIKSASREQVKNIGRIVSDGVRDGKTLGEMKKSIREASEGMTRNKAELIARDQVGDLNAALNKDRQTSAGISLYWWRGTDDGRERASHEEMNGKLCRWDDADVYSEDGGKSWEQRNASMPHAHPGEEINCRCYAEAAIEAMLDLED